jgi:hypothetical protein
LTTAGDTSQRLHYFLWAPSPTDRRIRLTVESAVRLGYKPGVVLCSSTPEKPVTLLARIAELGDHEIVLCTDAFDVLCTEPPATVKDKFLSMRNKILFGAESLCFHHIPAARRYFELSAGETPYPYLNSGMFIGFAGAIRQMLRTFHQWNSHDLKRQFESVPENPGRFDDQSLFGMYAALNPGTVGLDNHAHVFLNLSRHYSSLSSDLAWESGRVINKVTTSRPSFLHLTQVRRYYPSYLNLAERLGIEVRASNVDIELVRQHLAGNPSVKASDSGTLDVTVERRIRRSPSFQIREMMDLAISSYRSARFNFGKYRRRLFSSVEQD